MNQLVYLKNVVTLKLDQKRCIGCGMCLMVCPHAVFRLTNGTSEIVNRDACMECGACSRNCPAGALSVLAGVGCAAAVINSKLGRRKATCCCLEPAQSQSSCCEDQGTSGCC